MLLRALLTLSACLLLAACGGSPQNIQIGNCTTPETSDWEEGTPAQGVYGIQEPVQWHEVMIPAEHGVLEHRFKWANVATVNGQCLTLIAGAVGDPNAVDVCDRGVAAPAKTPAYKPGLTLRDDRGGPDTPERATIRGGFLVLMATQSAAKVQGMQWSPWPLVVGTPRLPGAAESGWCVFLTVPDFDGTSLRECVLRPNPHPVSDLVDSPDGDTGETIHVDWSSRTGADWHFHLSEVSMVDWFGGDAKVTPIDGDDARFLRDVARFIDQAWPHMTGDSNRSGCP
jgi:hypothetical protein